MQEFIFSMKVMKVMKGDFKKINFIMIFLFTCFTCDANAVRDYEWQLNHIEQTLKRNSVKFSNEGNLIVKLTFLTKNIHNANSLKKHYKDFSPIIVKGKWLSYSHKLSVSFQLKLNNMEFKNWLRLQFFIGVANYCDLDGVVIESIGSP